LSANQIDWMEPYRQCDHLYGMRSRLLILVFALSALTGCHRAVSPPLLTASGYAAVKFGMPLSAAESEVKETLLPTPGALDCTYVAFTSYPGIRFMVERGVVVRADATANIANGAGVVFGASIDQVRTAHPSVEVQPHKYEPDGNYLILAGAEPNSAYVFEAKAGKISAIRAGMKPAVLYVEGCG